MLRGKTSAPALGRQTRRGQYAVPEPGSRGQAAYTALDVEAIKCYRARARDSPFAWGDIGRRPDGTRRPCGASLGSAPQAAQLRGQERKARILCLVHSVRDAHDHASHRAARACGHGEDRKLQLQQRTPGAGPVPGQLAGHWRRTLPSLVLRESPLHGRRVDEAPLPVRPPGPCVQLAGVKARAHNALRASRRLDRQGRRAGRRRWGDQRLPGHSWAQAATAAAQALSAVHHRTARVAPARLAPAASLRLARRDAWPNVSQVDPCL